jgi:hypothetical protein
MPKIEYAKKEEEELEEWLESDRIESVKFPTTEPAVDIQFDNQLFIRLKYSGANYTFNGGIEIRDRKNLISNAIEIRRRDTEILLMAFNLLESDSTDGFIRACGEHVQSLWTDT